MIKDIILVGITGTSGKTTTAYLTYQMLKKSGEKVAYIGTIGFYMNDFIKNLDNTTPGLYDIYNMLLTCKDNNIKYVIMEVSSHSLDLNRLNTIYFDVVAITNISKEHLDYHKNINNYVKCKTRLFNKLRNNKIAIINKDDKYYKNFILKENKNILISNSLINNVIINANYTKFKFNYKNNNYNININLIGYYNIYNYIISLIIVNNLGYKIENIIKFNKEFTPPPGRMELIKYKNNSIYIDYAHKPDAVLKVLTSVKEFKKGKVITIIGCGGNRDKSKRPVMANISCKYSDYVIFTNDNPRNENKENIIKDMINNLKYLNYEVIYNRKKAIQKAIKLLKNKDILLILGKGHEDYQIIKNKKIHLSDKEEVLKIVK